jgi:hypothetical protein
MIKFDRYVCVGDTATWSVEGFDITARIEYDADTKPEDCDCFDIEDPDHGAENRKIVDAWRNDEWFYCGVILSVSRNGVTITKHAASLWGIEANFPGSDNAYLAEVCQELQSEAIATARAESVRIISALAV